MNILTLNDISVVRRGRTTLSCSGLSVERGDFVAITGPNGGGKTTLLRVMLRLLQPTTGSVTYYGRDGSAVQRLAIGYLPQKSAIDSRFPITVAELIASGLMGIKGLSKTEVKGRVDAMISEIELESHASATIGTLSGGQMQRALLGRALISRPELLVLDEPLSYLDKHFEHRVYEILRHEACEATIVLVSHEMSTISGMANRHIIVDHTVTPCHASHHQVHYDCDDESDDPSMHS